MKIELEIQVMRLKGLAGLLEAGTECNGKILNQSEVFAFLAGELMEIAEKLEDVMFKEE